MMSATCGLTIYDSRNYLVLIDTLVAHGVNGEDLR